MKTKIFLPLLTLTLTASLLVAQPVPELAALTGNHETITAQAETETSWWLGTTHGIYRITKKNMKVKHYTTSNSLLPSDFITSICAMSDGQVYIGTKKGILRYDRFAFLIISTENSRLPSDNIRSLDCNSPKGIVVETEADFSCPIK